MDMESSFASVSKWTHGKDKGPVDKPGRLGEAKG
jgi:hypothetical protein